MLIRWISVTCFIVTQGVKWVVLHSQYSDGEYFNQTGNQHHTIVLTFSLHFKAPPPHVNAKELRCQGRDYNHHGYINSLIVTWKLNIRSVTSIKSAVYWPLLFTESVDRFIDGFNIQWIHKYILACDFLLKDVWIMTHFKGPAVMLGWYANLCW